MVPLEGDVWQEPSDPNEIHKYIAKRDRGSGQILRWRWLVTGAFGLVHGFGFSFALRQDLQFAGDHLLVFASGRDRRDAGSQKKKHAFHPNPAEGAVGADRKRAVPGADLLVCHHASVPLRLFGIGGDLRGVTPVTETPQSPRGCRVTADPARRDRERQGPRMIQIKEKRNFI